jgi:hypothetical protein
VEAEADHLLHLPTKMVVLVQPIQLLVHLLHELLVALVQVAHLLQVAQILVMVLKAAVKILLALMVDQV